MTDRDHTDELVSAFLDGEATDEEAAQVRRDPELLRRLEQLRATSEAVGGAPEPPTEAARDAAVERALAAYDEGDGTPRRPGVLVGLSAAALVVLLALAFSLVALVGGDDQGEDLATESPAAEADGEALALDDQSGGLDAPVDLGRIGDVEELQDAVDEATADLDSAPRAADEATGEAGDAAAPEAFAEVGPDAGCEPELRALDEDLGELRLVATAVYRETPALVYVFGLADGSTRIQVAATGTCALVVSTDSG